MPKKLVVPLLSVLVLVVGRPDDARAESRRVEDFLIIAEDAFLDVEYEDAFEALERAENLGEASERQTARILALRGTIHYLLEDEAQARQEYGRALAIDPGFQLPETHPPRAVEFFNSLRRVQAAEVTIEHEPPQPLSAGERMLLTARVRGVTDRHTVQIFFRPYGERSYSSTEMRRSGVDVFTGEIPPGGSIDTERGCIVEYFIMVAVGETRITNEGTPRNPLSFELRGSGGETVPGSTPVVRRWWFWTIIGLAVGAGLGFGLGFGLNTEEEVPTGTVDLTLTFDTD